MNEQQGAYPPLPPYDKKMENFLLQLVHGDFMADNTEDLTAALDLPHWIRDYAKACISADRAARATGAEQHLANLLARIHGDGGHYTSEHGIEKSVADADLLISQLHATGSEPMAWMSPGKERHEFADSNTVYGSHTIPLYAPPLAAPPAAQPLSTFTTLKFQQRRDRKATVTLLVPDSNTADAWVRGITKEQS